MFSIDSYIKIPNKKVVVDNKVNTTINDCFISIKDEKRILGLKNEIDFDYIEGYLCIQYNQEKIIDYNHWDLIDQLWAYLLNMIESYLKHNKASTFFPDQPTSIEMNRISENLVLFTLNSSEVKKITFPVYDFFNSLLEEGRFFFETMIKIFGNAIDYSHELSLISVLRRKVNEIYKTP